MFNPNSNTLISKNLLTLTSVLINFPVSASLHGQQGGFFQLQDDLWDKTITSYAELELQLKLLIKQGIECPCN